MLVDIKEIQQKQERTNHENNMEAKSNNKNHLQKYAILSCSDGITMVGQDQGPQ